jgi:hypothetical protein
MVARCKKKNTLSSDSKLRNANWNESKKLLLRRVKMLRVVPAGEGLIAPASAIAASPVSAASAIASSRIARIARTVERGMIAAEPTGDDPALGRGIVAAVGQEAVAWRAPVCAAILQTRHQKVANQRCTADCNCECCHLARH